jgi:hypothetical protein
MGPINQFKSIQHNRQQGLRAYCSNIYTVHNKGQIPRGHECVKKQADNWLIPINGHLIDSNQLIKENLLVYEPQSRSKVCARIYFFVIFYSIDLKLSSKENFKIICYC